MVKDIKNEWQKKSGFIRNRTDWPLQWLPGGSLRFWVWHLGKELARPRGSCPPRGVRGHAPQKILKFYSRRDVFSCSLKLQTTTFNNQKKITLLVNHDLIPIPTTQIGLFGSLLIALLIIIFTQTHCQHLSRNQLIFKISMTRREEHCFNVNAPKIISLA